MQDASAKTGALRYFLRSHGMYRHLLVYSPARGEEDAETRRALLQLRGNPALRSMTLERDYYWSGASCLVIRELKDAALVRLLHPDELG